MLGNRVGSLDALLTRKSPKKRQPA
jgi:hypothetical protein